MLIDFIRTWILIGTIPSTVGSLIGLTNLQFADNSLIGIMLG